MANGIIPRLLSDPARLNMALMGLGLLTAKKQSEAQPYIRGMSSGLLDMAQHKRGAAKRQREEEAHELAMQAAKAKLGAPGQVRDLIGQPASAFEADLFPGEAPIPGLRNEAKGLLGGKLSPQDFATSLLGIPGYETAGASLLGKQVDAKQGYKGPDGTVWKDYDQYLKARTSARKQIEPYANQVRELRSNFETLVSSAQAPETEGRGAADTAMIFSFAKMLDPRSVVRGEEGETIQRSDGVFGQLQGFLQDIQGKGKLTASAREGLVKQAYRELVGKGVPIHQQMSFIHGSASPLFGDLASPEILGFKDWAESYEFPTYYGTDPVPPAKPNPDRADTFVNKLQGIFSQ